mgnify:CR=1 FL=1
MSVGKMFGVILLIIGVSVGAYGGVVYAQNQPVDSEKVFRDNRRQDRTLFDALGSLNAYDRAKAANRMRADRRARATPWLATGSALALGGVLLFVLAGREPSASEPAPPSAQ